MDVVAFKTIMMGLTSSWEICIINICSLEGSPGRYGEKWTYCSCRRRISVLFFFFATECHISSDERCAAVPEDEDAVDGPVLIDTCLLMLIDNDRGAL